MRYMTVLTPLGSKVTISFKVRFRFGISASHYGANGAIYIAAGTNAHQCNYRGSGQAQAPLECPMQLPIVTCIRADPLTSACMPLCK